MTTTTEENKALVRRFHEGLWRGNVALIDELIAPDTSMAGMSPQQLKAWALDWLKRAPDLTLKIDEMIAEGDKVVYRWTFQSTHTSEVPTPYGPAAPTNKVITASGITIERVQGGKIVEDYIVGNDLSLFQQLGVIPMPSQSSG